LLYFITFALFWRNIGNINNIHTRIASAFSIRMIINNVIIYTAKKGTWFTCLLKHHASIHLTPPTLIAYSALLYLLQKYKSVNLLFKLKTYCLLLIYYLLFTYHKVCSYLSTFISTLMYAFCSFLTLLSVILPALSLSSL